jgi:hypothetical protein
MHSKSFLIYEGDDFGLKLEYNKDYAILHLPYVNKWSPSVFKKLGIKVYDTLDFVKTLGYKGIHTGIHQGDTKGTKIVLMLGGEYLGTYSGFDIYGVE